MSATPCVGNADIYDALFDDVPEPQRQAAHAKAAILCGRCPAPCPEKVTATSGTRMLTLLPTEWLPPTTEGRPEPEPRTVGKRGPRKQEPRIGFDYVAADKRVQAWARMAAERAAQGWKLADIADDLCVSEDTAQRLLNLSHQLAA